MHWDSLVEPLFGLKVPAAHGVHGARPVGDQVPGAHWTEHCDWWVEPGNDVKPDGHFSHAAMPQVPELRLKNPAGHFWHEDDDEEPLFGSAYVPAGQASHRDCPPIPVAEKKPQAQSLQSAMLLAPGPLILPSGHLEHSVRLGLLNVPGVHCVH